MHHETREGLRRQRVGRTQLHASSQQHLDMALLMWWPLAADVAVDIAIPVTVVSPARRGPRLSRPLALALAFVARSFAFLTLAVPDPPVPGLLERADPLSRVVFIAALFVILLLLLLRTFAAAGLLPLFRELLPKSLGLALAEAFLQPLAQALAQRGEAAFQIARLAAETVITALTVVKAVFLQEALGTIVPVAAALAGEAESRKWLRPAAIARHASVFPGHLAPRPPSSPGLVHALKEFLQALDVLSGQGLHASSLLLEGQLVDGQKKLKDGLAFVAGGSRCCGAIIVILTIRGGQGSSQSSLARLQLLCGGGQGLQAAKP
mmetsp:Transcript_76789/g.167804  ORF Transcript_76789/g.167804 Transcript_76789/m.167804 type:complete len:322 (-) Transcript_76789:1083-2048(-)